MVRETEKEKNEWLEKNSWLETEVLKLQLQVLEGEKFDLALITGSGKGRPKADAFAKEWKQPKGVKSNDVKSNDLKVTRTLTPTRTLNLNLSLNLTLTLTPTYLNLRN